jgi:hypothetical protein
MLAWAKIIPFRRNYRPGNTNFNEQPFGLVIQAAFIEYCLHCKDAIRRDRIVICAPELLEPCRPLFSVPEKVPSEIKTMLSIPGK